MLNEEMLCRIMNEYNSNSYQSKISLWYPDDEVQDKANIFGPQYEVRGISTAEPTQLRRALRKCQHDTIDPAFKDQLQQHHDSIDLPSIRYDGTGNTQYLTL